MTVQQFASAMKKRSDALEKANGYTVPHSYRSINMYLAGERVPRDELFSRHAAEELGVRWQWLHGNDGPMTDHEVALTTLNAFASPSFITEPPDPAGSPVGTTRRMAKIAPRLVKTPPALAAFITVWDRVISGSPSPLTPEQQYKIAERIWKQITALLDVLGVEPDAMDAVPDYCYVTLFGALMAAVPGPGKGKDLSAAARRNAKTTKPKPRRS